MALSKWDEWVRRRDAEYEIQRNNLATERANAEQTAAEEKRKPVTWRRVTVLALITGLSSAAPFVIKGQDLQSWFARLSLVAFAIASFCAFSAHFVGRTKRWNRGKAEDASGRTGAWVFGLPIGITGLWFVGSAIKSCTSDALSGVPGWALVIIVLLVLVLFKR